MAKTNEGGIGGKTKATAAQSKLTLQSGLGYTIMGTAPAAQQATPNLSPIVQPFITPGLVMGAGGYGTAGGAIGAPTAAVRTTPAMPYPGIYPQYQTPVVPAGPLQTTGGRGQNVVNLPGTTPAQSTTGDYGLRHPQAPPTLAQQMASVYAANPRLSALGGTPGTNQPNTAFEDLYGRSGLGEGLAVQGAGYAMTHGATVPTPWEIRMQKNYGQAAGGTLAPTEVKDRTRAAGGTLAPTQPPLVVTPSPTYTPRRSGTGFGGYGSAYYGDTSGNRLINWRIGY